MISSGMVLKGPSPSMTRADLLDAIYRFYARGMLHGGVGYEETEERSRQREAARRGAAGHASWRAMLQRLGARYRWIDGSVFTPDGLHDPAYAGQIVIPGYLLGFHVSVLGPFYGIQRTGSSGEEAAALDLAREIEASYPGHEPIPPDLGNEVVPDVCLDGRYFGQATVYDCLLSQSWLYSSLPCDKVKPALDVEDEDEEEAGACEGEGEPEPLIHYKHTRR